MTHPLNGEPQNYKEDYERLVPTVNDYPIKNKNLGKKLEKDELIVDTTLP